MGVAGAKTKKDVDVGFWYATKFLFRETKFPSIEKVHRDVIYVSKLALLFGTINLFFYLVWALLT